MKKTLLSLTALSAVILSACSLTTETEVREQVQAETNTEISNKPETVEILGTSDSMDSMNVMRDQLETNGFNVEFNIQPDFASVLAQRDAGNYDVLAIGWTTVTGAPDYAVRSLYHSEGDMSNISDPRVDELIDLGATQTPDEYIDTYTEFEELVVDEMAYTVPLYTQYQPLAHNMDIIDGESLTNYNAREMPWEGVSFLDEAANESESLVLAQRYNELTSFDPIQANDASVSKINTNMYVRLLNLDENDEPSSEGSLSRNHTTAEGNQDHYFILRDDINFAAVEDGQAVDTGEMVSGNDAVYSIQRAANAESVPDHRSFSLFESIDNVELVSDMSELEETNVAVGEGSVLDSLEEGLDNPVEQVVTEDESVDNANGSYQVVKVTTGEAFPQILNNLAHTSAGIVSEDQVESINDFEVSEYNPAVHTRYGDQQALVPGASYDNHLYASGPYIMLEKNNTEASFQANPGYMPETDNYPEIQNVSLRLITDMTSLLSAFRSGEIHILDEIAPTKYEVVQEEPNLNLDLVPSNAVYYLQLNTNTPGKPTTESANFRKAIMYSIDQGEISAINANNTLPAYTTLTPVIDTGNTAIEADPAKVEEHYQAYLNE